MAVEQLPTGPSSIIRLTENGKQAIAASLASKATQAISAQLSRRNVIGATLRRLLYERDEIQTTVYDGSHVDGPYTTEAKLLKDEIEQIRRYVGST